MFGYWRNYCTGKTKKKTQVQKNKEKMRNKETFE